MRVVIMRQIFFIIGTKVKKSSYFCLMKKILPLVLLFISASVFGQNEAAIAAKADSLHKVFFTIDTHNDYAIYACHPDAEDYSVEKGQVSFPMMVEGGLDASVFAIYMGQAGRSEDSLQLAVEYGVRELTLFKEFVEKNYSDYVEIAYSADDLLRIKSEGKRAVLLSLENGYMLGKDIKNVEMFYNLGIRLITLCHFGDNDVCDSANGSKDEWGGLSPFGVEVVKEMNRLGMIVDLSHCSRTTLYDCIKLSKAPIVASHSGVYNYKAIPRNLTDPEMLKIAAKDGYIGLPAGRYFLSHKPKKELSVANIIDHVDYVKNLLGKEYIGIGTDFDGGAGVPGFENMSKMKELTKEMLRRGYTDEEIECFWGKNFIRVFKAVEAAAQR